MTYHMGTTSRSDVAFVFSQCKWALNDHLHRTKATFFFDDCRYSMWTLSLTAKVAH